MASRSIRPNQHKASVIARRTSEVTLPTAGHLHAGDAHDVPLSSLLQKFA
jgi:hypothetical protein